MDFLWLAPDPSRPRGTQVLYEPCKAWKEAFAERLRCVLSHTPRPRRTGTHLVVFYSRARSIMHPLGTVTLCVEIAKSINDTHAAIWLPPEGDVDDPLEGGPENHAHFGLVLFRPSRGTHHPHHPLEGLNVHIPSSRGAHHPLAGLNVHIPSFKGA